MNTDEYNELKKENEELQILFDSVPAWIFYKDRKNVFVKVNKTFCDAMQMSSTELEGASLYDIYPKEQADAFWANDKEVIESNKSKIGIIEQVNTAAGLRWAQVDKIPYKNTNGDIVGIIGFAIDITERKNAEESKEKTQSMLQNIIDLLPIRIFWKDKKLNYLGCNKAFAADAGKQSPAELIGRNDFDMAWKEQADLYRADDKKVIDADTPKLDYDEPQTTPKGDKIWLNTNKMPLKNGNGEIYGILGTYFDITDHKQAEEQLKEQAEQLQKTNDMMVGREIRMTELKDQIKVLEARLKDK